MSLGTPLYMAPELARYEEYSFEVDIWALGVITHNILLGKPPFIGKDKHETFEKICSQEVDLEPFSKFKNNGEEIKDFISKCLAKNPEDRLSALELLEHPWLDGHLADDEVVEEKQIDIGLSLYTFKRSSIFQSSVISILTRLKPDNEEIAELRKIF